MSGFGKPDDELEHATQRIAELIALAQSNLPTGKGTLQCVVCLDPIPEARRKAMPGTRYCIHRQEAQDKLRPTFKNPWAT